MSNPYEKLANILKEHKNPVFLGPTLAFVEEPMPNLKLKLLNGNMIIDVDGEGDNIFIARSLTNRINIDVTFEDFESQNNSQKNPELNTVSYEKLSANKGEIGHTPLTVTGTCTTGAVSGTATWTPAVDNISLFNVNINKISGTEGKNDKEQKEKGKFKAQFLITLKKGDAVLVIPNVKEDQFYIIDIFDNVKDVEDKWEYYQKS